MTKHADVEWRRKWVKSYVNRYKPVTVAQVAQAAHAAAIPTLTDCPTKTYHSVSKDTRLLRRHGDIEPGSIVFHKLG